MPAFVHPKTTAFASAEDRALELATRPKRGTVLTDDEKKARRRLQYKLHQRRHRAKQDATAVEHEQAIAQLRQCIDGLEQRRHAYWASGCIPHQGVFEARATNMGAPARLAMEYLRLFEHGYVDSHAPSTQEQFLRSVMIPTVAGPDYQGVDTLVNQWRLYQAFFPHTHVSFEGLEVNAAGQLTVVVASVVFALQGGRRRGIVALYPSIEDDEHVIQTMVGMGVRIPGKLRFVFEASGACSWFGSELDFVAGLQRALGSLRAAAKCLEGANMSLATGQIRLEQADSRAQHEDTLVGH